jgi:hypothetical protein
MLIDSQFLRLFFFSKKGHLVTRCLDGGGFELEGEEFGEGGVEVIAATNNARAAQWNAFRQQRVRGQAEQMEGHCA